MKVMFKCLWKNCEKVLSTSSGIQRHIRTVHLGFVSAITHKHTPDTHTQGAEFNVRLMSELMNESVFFPQFHVNNTFEF